MPDYTTRERPYRQRTRTREEPRPDAAATALTAQIVICVILVVCLFAAKSVNPTRYAAVRGKCLTMLSDTGETDKALAWFSRDKNSLGLSLDRLKKYVDGLLPKKTETETQTDPWAGIDVDEPEDEVSPPKLPQYDYLDSLRDETAGASISPIRLSVPAKPPLTGIITSGFERREHPITGKEDFHTGLDVAAPEGEPILAALPGNVEETGWSDVYGKYIVLKHSDNLKTSYSHCSSIIAREGMAVRQGERIALVGDTGAATGPHLHFSVIVDGEFTDPSWILADYIRVAG